MGCNTSQELKTKDGTTSNGDGTNPMENGQLENGNANGGGPGDEPHQHHQKCGSSAKSSGSMSSGNHTNHSKSNSIISNKDGGSMSASAKQNGLQLSDGEHHRRCDKAEISELNDIDMGEDEGTDAEEEEVEIRIPHHHHHHGSKKIRRNPLKNLDLDFKFDVNSF